MRMTLPTRTSPIIIEVDIELLPSQYGIFSDYFSPDDSSMLKIRYQQSIRDAYPNVIHMESNESIPVKALRKVNFLKYETTAAPSKELRLNTQRGAGMLVNSIIERFIAEGDRAFLNDKRVRRLKEYINRYLGKIRSFRDFSIKANIAKDTIEMLTNLSICLMEREKSRPQEAVSNTWRWLQLTCSAK